MKLSFSTLGCPDWDLQAIVKSAGQYGFDGVELRAKGSQHVDPGMGIEERKNVKKLFMDGNIEVCCLAGYSTFCSSDAAELEHNADLLNSYVNLASDLGAKLVRTFIGNYSSLMTEDEVVKNVTPYLAKCGHIAEENGVTIIIETHDSFSTGASVAKLIRNINSKGVAVLWDIHHPYRAGETVEETYRQIGPSLRHVHVKDEVDGKLCLTGKGSLPIKEIVTLLKEKGYTGYLSLEWEKMWVKELEEPEIAFPSYIEYIRSILK